jgi:hypothetical protein
MQRWGNGAVDMVELYLLKDAEEQLFCDVFLPGTPLDLRISSQCDSCVCLPEERLSYNIGEYDLTQAFPSGRSLGEILQVSWTGSGTPGDTTYATIRHGYSDRLVGRLEGFGSS